MLLTVSRCLIRRCASERGQIAPSGVCGWVCVRGPVTAGSLTLITLHGGLGFVLGEVHERLDVCT